MTALLACLFLQTKLIDDGSQYRRINHFGKVRIAHECEYKVIAVFVGYTWTDVTALPSALCLIVILCVALLQFVPMMLH